MAIPNRSLETARLQRRWSVEVASGKVGVSVNTFNRWERGLQVPQLETLDQLCKAFAMSPEELGFAHAMLIKRRHKQASNPPPIELVAHPYWPTTLSPPSSKETPTGLLHSQPIDHENYSNPPQTYRSLDTMRPQSDSDGEISRRKAITLLISTPATVFGLTQQQPGSLLHPEEVITLSMVNIPLCWQLYFEGGFSELKHILPGYLSQLTPLAHLVSPYQRRASALASQAHQLAYLLALQCQDFGIALHHTQEAARYAQIADDPNLLVASIVRQGYVYYCLHHTEQRLQLYEQALRTHQNCSPLLQGYLYAGLAEVHAKRNERDTALDFLQRAIATFPQQPEDDPNFSYTHFRWIAIHNFAGLVHLYLNQPQDAWTIFEHIDRTQPAIAPPYRAEIATLKAATNLKLGDLDHACSLITFAAQSALALGSNLRYDEACTVYEQMQKQWKHEPQVKALQELFHQKISIYSS